MKNTGFKSVDDYIGSFPPDVQKRLETLRQAIKTVVPEAEEVISYQIPTFKWHGTLVHFAAFKNHIGFYPTPSGIEAFHEELKGYNPAKGSVKFPMGKPIPIELVQKIVAFKREENLDLFKIKKQSKL